VATQNSERRRETVADGVSRTESGFYGQDGVTGAAKVSTVQCIAGGGAHGPDLVAPEAARGLEISHTLPTQRVYYLTMRIRVDKGSLLATEYVGIMQIEHESDTS